MSAPARRGGRQGRSTGGGVSVCSYAVLICCVWASVVYLIRLTPGPEEPAYLEAEPLAGTLAVQQAKAYPKTGKDAKGHSRGHSSKGSDKASQSRSSPPHDITTKGRNPARSSSQASAGSFSRADQEAFLEAERARLAQESFSASEIQYLQYVNFPEQDDLVVTTQNLGRLKRRQPFSKAFPKDKLLPQNWTEPIHDTCALVGSSGLLKRNNYGSIIDSHEVVVRMNQAPTQGYEALVGSKTTYRMLNNKWTTLYFEDNIPSKEVGTTQTAKFLIKQEAPGTSLVVTRAGTATFEQLALTQHRRRPDLRTLYLNSHLNNWARKLLLAFENVTVTSGAKSTGLHIERRRRGLLKSGKDPDQDSNVSTGFLSLFFMLQICKRVAVYGFTLPDESNAVVELQGKAPYHYFRKYVDSENLRAHPHHNFKLEGLLLKNLHDKRFIRLCAHNLMGAKMGDECGW